MLSELLVAETIRLNVEVANWEEAIRFGGTLLKTNATIEQSYIEAMIETVKTLGPYIVIAPQIAMPHASEKEGVNQLGLSLITLKEPVPFGHKENDPVKIVICLAATDHHSHLEALKELMTLLSNQAFIDQLKQANRVEVIIKSIRDVEQKSEDERRGL